MTQEQKNLIKDNFYIKRLEIEYNTLTKGKLSGSMIPEDKINEYYSDSLPKDYIEILKEILNETNYFTE